MMHSRRSIALIGALCLVIGACSVRAANEPVKPAAEKPATEKPAAEKPAAEKPANPAAAAAANAKITATAIAALRKEYQAHLKDAKATLRDKCDYFKENAAELSPADVLKALEQSVTGDAGLQAYVKWQLLSGFSGKFPDELEKRAVAVYRRAPLPADHPGLNHRSLSKAAGGLRGPDIDAAQKEFDAVLDKNMTYNSPILAFRDEMYLRLPNKPEVFAAGFEDVAERTSHGMNAAPIFDSVSGAIRSWAVVDAKPGQAKGMADSVKSLKEVVTKADKPFAKLAPDAKATKWQPDAQATIPPAKFDDLIKFLTDSSSPANGGGLKFKDK